MTNYIFRCLIVCPAANRAAFNTWILNNLDPTGGDWFVASLSAAGNVGDTPTHYWCNAALTAAEFKKLMQRLCTLASITAPADWDTMTRQEKKRWLLGQRAAIRTATGIRVLPMDNDGVWDSPQDELAAAGLNVIASAPL